MKCVSAFSYFITVFLFATGKTAMISVVSSFLSILLAIALFIGGGKLHSMLSNGSDDEKSRTVAAAIKRLFKCMILIQPVLLLAMGYYVTGE